MTFYLKTAVLGMILPFVFSGSVFAQNTTETIVSEKTHYYRVKKDDTVEAIASQSGLTQEQVKQLATLETVDVLQPNTTVYVNNTDQTVLISEGEKLVGYDLKSDKEMKSTVPKEYVNLFWEAMSLIGKQIRDSLSDLSVLTEQTTQTSQTDNGTTAVITTAVTSGQTEDKSVTQTTQVTPTQSAMTGTVQATSQVVKESRVTQAPVTTQVQRVTQAPVTTQAPTTTQAVTQAASQTAGVVSLNDFLYRGVVNSGGYKYTYYSQSVLPGGGLNIPGRHVNAAGYVADKDGYIVVANNDLPKGSVVQTPFGAPGKVYDRGTSGNHIDVYVR